MLDNPKSCTLIFPCNEYCVSQDRPIFSLSEYFPSVFLIQGVKPKTQRKEGKCFSLRSCKFLTLYSVGGKLMKFEYGYFVVELFTFLLFSFYIFFFVICMASSDIQFAERYEVLLLNITELYPFPIRDSEVFPRRRWLTNRCDLDIIVSHSFQCGQIFLGYYL